MNCPPISRITFTMTRNMTGPKPAEIIAPAICCGICSSVSTCLRISAFAMMNISVIVSLPASNRVSLVSLWKKAVTNAMGLRISGVFGPPSLLASGPMSR